MISAFAKIQIRNEFAVLCGRILNERSSLCVEYQNGNENSGPHELWSFTVYGVFAHVCVVLYCTQLAYVLCKESSILAHMRVQCNNWRRVCNYTHDETRAFAGLLACAFVCTFARGAHLQTILNCIIIRFFVVVLLLAVVLEPALCSVKFWWWVLSWLCWFVGGIYNYDDSDDDVDLHVSLLMVW